MTLDWSSLGAAFALYLILEGVMPFLNPQGVKRALTAILRFGDSQLRWMGLASMLSGLMLLYWLQG